MYRLPNVGVNAIFYPQKVSETLKDDSGELLQQVDRWRQYGIFSNNSRVDELFEHP
jgi:hypothetical protein